MKPSDALRRALNPRTPFLALSAIKELKSIVTDAEREAVFSAREQGATWDDIAATLGVTRQAVQQRFGHMNGSTPTPSA
jgi:hypothetical protein